MLEGLRFHHIGVATRGIEKELPEFERLGYTALSSVFSDKTMRIRGLMLAAPGQPTLELLENMDEGGPLDVPLKRGIKFYHFAYEAEDIEKTVRDLLEDGRAKLVYPVSGAEYFRRVCFLMLPNMALIELVETGQN